MTIETITTRPPVITAAQQLARHWEHITQHALVEGGTLRFCEPSEYDLSHLYACALPPRDQRRSPAISFIITPSAPLDEQSPVQRISIEVTAQATDTIGGLPECMALLNELLATLRPNHEPFSYAGPSGYAGAYPLHGVIGLPPMSAWGEAPSLDLWRMIAIDIQQYPTPLSVHLGAGATPDGELSARMTISLVCVPAAVPAPVEVLRLVRANTAEGKGDITIENTGSTKRLRLRNDILGDDIYTIRDIDLLAGASDSIAEVAALIGTFAEWTIVNHDTDFNARSSRELLFMHAVDATLDEVVLGMVE